MYEQMRKPEHAFMPPVQMKEIESRIARMAEPNNPYEGKPLQVSGRLANNIRRSFGLNAEELSLRESPEVAARGARALAQGNSIRFAPGEFRPDTKEGMQVLGHELNHVREQALGKVHAPGGQLFEHPKHEAASDAAGAAFANGGLTSAAPVSVEGMNAGAQPAQGLFGWSKREREQADMDDMVLNNFRKHRNENQIEGVRLNTWTDEMQEIDREAKEKNEDIDTDWLDEEPEAAPEKKGFFSGIIEHFRIKKKQKRRAKRDAEKELDKAYKFHYDGIRLEQVQKENKRIKLLREAGIMKPDSSYIPLKYKGRDTASYSNQELQQIVDQPRKDKQAQKRAAKREQEKNLREQREQQMKKRREEEKAQRKKWKEEEENRRYQQNISELERRRASGASGTRAEIDKKQINW